MCIYIYIYAHIYIYIYIYIYIHIYIYIYIYVCVCVCVGGWVCGCVGVCAHIYNVKANSFKINNGMTTKSTGQCSCQFKTIHRSSKVRT